jgi:hypothetical protein
MSEHAGPKFKGRSRMNKRISAVDHGTQSESADEETERIVLGRLASFDEETKTAVDAREALVGIRRNLQNSSTPAR